MKKIKIGQIGIGHNHGAAKAADCKRLSALFEFVGVVAPESDRAYFDRKTLDVYKDVPFMTEEELFAVPDLDAVLIETAVPNLVPTGLAAVRRGLHIHLDKPAGEDPDLFETLLQTAKEKHLAVQMGYMYRYNPSVLYALEQIKAGKLGDIHTIDAQMSTEHAAAFRAFLSQFAGGSMYIFGCHLIDLIVQIKGRPKEILPFPLSSGHDGLHFPDNCAAALLYDDGTCFVRTSSVEVNGFGRRQIAICGTRGSIEIKPIEGPTRLTEAYAGETSPWKDLHREVELPRQEHRYTAMLTDFAKMIRGEGENPYTYEHDLYVQKATLAACGLPVKL
ncbi:MAG: Gfo/Idh/MocA family oxidoreductase [Clostridia bacterium]|nr:Gfo/Idh/MocA family oxidoreductase [Clostridia bacterium]